MTNNILPQTIHQQTTDALAALIRQQRYVATFCAACGALGTVYSADRVTLLCGRCRIIEHGGKPDDNMV